MAEFRFHWDALTEAEKALTGRFYLPATFNKFATLCCLFLLPPMASAQQVPKASGYVGSRACGACHAEISRAYFQTAMGRASGKVEPEARNQPEPGSFLHVPSRTRYSLQADAAGLALTYNKAPQAEEPAISGTRQLEYYIGSGSHARGYIYRSGDMFFQAPIGYYTTRRQWDMAPGYETGHSIFLGRKIEQSCLDCHASGQAAPEPFAEGDVSCERCHGPGSEHMMKFAPHQASLSPGPGILNPAKLPPMQRDSVCAQCHLTGEARIQKQNASAFVAGDQLTNYVVPFVWSASNPDDLKVIGHFEGLRLSRCKQASGDQLWCGTCHDPHREPEPSAKPAYFRAKCLTCHTESSCTAKANLRSTQADSCITCHMPKRQTVDGLHTAFTDHSIRRYGNDKMPAVQSSRQDLVPFWPGTGSPRDLALAYMDVASRSRQEADYLRAYAAFQKALPSANDDAELLSNLGYLHDLAGSPQSAVQSYERALRSNPQNTLALTNLGQHLATEGKIAEAIQLWQRAIKIDPGLATPSLNLGRAFFQQGNITEARNALAILLRFNPDSSQGLALKKQIDQAPK